MITIRAYLRASSANKEGAAAIYFIIQPGEVWITTKIFCTPSEWDEENQTIKRKHSRYNQVSPTYNQYRSRADHFVATLNVEQRPFIKSDFINYVFKGDTETSNPLLQQLIKQYKGAVAIGYERSKHYDQLLGDIQTIMPRARLKDIDAAFVQKLRTYLATKPGKQNNANTITRKIKQVKALVHYAIRERYINADPLVAIRLKEIKGVKNYLEPAELAAVEHHYKDGLMTADMRETLRAFLFSCYTGLRYIDIKQLERKHLQEDRVVLVQEKTDRPVVIPLIDKAKALLHSSRRYGLLFDLASDQVVNKQLKRIAAAAGVHKHITYHCSRHTFATLSIYFGIPYEIVAEILGVDYKTAKVYAKIMDDVKFREMQKWG